MENVRKEGFHCASEFLPLLINCETAYGFKNLSLSSSSPANFNRSSLAWLDAEKSTGLSMGVYGANPWYILAMRRKYCEERSRSVYLKFKKLITGFPVSSK